MLRWVLIFILTGMVGTVLFVAESILANRFELFRMALLAHLFWSYGAMFIIAVLSDWVVSKVYYRGN